MREAAEIFGALGFPAGISADRFIINNKNLAAGDIEKAQYLFAAHYDTPLRMFVPINVIYLKALSCHCSISYSCSRFCLRPP